MTSETRKALLKEARGKQNEQGRTHPGDADHPERWEQHPPGEEGESVCIPQPTNTTAEE